MMNEGQAKMDEAQCVDKQEESDILYGCYSGSRAATKPEPDMPESDPWELEEGFPSDWVPTPNISPEVPTERYKAHVWAAIRWAVQIAHDVDDIYRLVEEWNVKNDPRVPDDVLRGMIGWAIKTWDTKFNPRYRRLK